MKLKRGKVTKSYVAPISDKKVETELTIEHATYKRGDKIRISDTEANMDFRFFSYVVKNNGAEYIQVLSNRSGGMHFYRLDRIILPPKPRLNKRKRRTKLEMEFARVAAEES